MPSRSRRAADEISKYKRLWEEAERQNRILQRKYAELSGQRLLLQVFADLLLTRGQIIDMLREPVEVQPGAYMHPKLNMWAAFMLENDLAGLTKEQMEEALNHGNT